MRQLVEAFGPRNRFRTPGGMLRAVPRNLVPILCLLAKSLNLPQDLDGPMLRVMLGKARPPHFD